MFSLTTLDHIRPHSPLENSSPYRVLFGRDHKGLEDVRISDNMAQEITTEEELNT